MTLFPMFHEKNQVKELTQRRELTTPAAAVATVIFLYDSGGYGPSVAFALILSGAAYYTTKATEHRSRARFLVLMVMVWVVLIHMVMIDAKDQLLTTSEGMSVSVVGKVCGVEGADEKIRVTVEVRECGKVKINNEKTLVTADMEIMKKLDLPVPSDVIRVTGKLSIPEPSRNPNTFDYRKYLKTKGIYTTIWAEDITYLNRDRGSIGARLFMARQSFIDDVSRRCGEDCAHLLKAILFGDKGSLDDDTVEIFQKNGTAHILAVSGLHVGMVYALIVWIWNSVGRLIPGTGGRRGWAFLVFTGTMLASYTILAGFSPSVVRAVLMIILHIFATMSGRYYDLKSATMAVFLAALLVDPFILFQSSFQMSFLAIFSISILLPYLRGFLTGSILACASVQLGLMPYMIYQFNWLSTAAILINIPVIFIAGLIVPLGIGSFGVSILTCLLPGNIMSNVLTVIPNKLIGILCEIMVRLNEICCVDPVTAIRVSSPSVWLVVAFYLGLVAFATEAGRLRIKRMGKSVAYAQAVIVLMVSLVIGASIDDGFRKMDMVFVDVGQGDCMHIRVNSDLKLPGGVNLGVGTKNYLIDGGGSDDYNVGRKTLKPYLLKNGVRTVDGAFVTHLHTDHYKGICELAREGMVKRIFVYEANRLRLREICDETGLDPRQISFLHAGHCVNLGAGSSSDTNRQEPDDSGPEQIRQEPDDSLQVLWPPPKTEADYAEMISDEENENAASLIMRVELDGVSLLATGDMGEDGEREVIAFARAWPDTPQQREGSAIRADILKVGHHGSKYSTCDEFLDAVSPGLAVIQVGKSNTYGHPTPEVLARLAGREIPVYRNDMQGAIGFRISDGRIKEVRTMIK